jgi:hypothetical protein
MSFCPLEGGPRTGCVEAQVRGDVGVAVVRSEEEVREATPGRQSHNIVAAAEDNLIVDGGQRLRIPLAHGGHGSARDHEVDVADGHC